MASAGGLGAARHNPDLPECNWGFLSRAIRPPPSIAINLICKISDQEHRNQSGMTCYIDPEVFLECISSAIQLDF